MSTESSPPPALQNVQRQVRFAQEYAISFDEAKAREAGGYSPNTRMTSQHGVAEVLTAQQMAKYEEGSRLRGEYIREYIYNILENCPTDYFVLAPDGDWVVDLEEFNKLPKSVKRLVETVELKWVAGRKYFKVVFISKSQALALAARFTMTQRLLAATTQIPWHEIMHTVDLDDEGLERSIEAMQAPLA